MMSYAKKHASVFTNKAWHYPFMVGMLKTLGGLFAWFTNAIVIMQSDDETEAVKDFIAVGIVYEIDNIVADTIFGSASKDDFEDPEITIEVKAETDKYTDRDVFNKYCPSSEKDDN